MKKFLSILLLIAVLISCCACGGGKTAEWETLPEDPNAPEYLYANIEPDMVIDGYHKIWNIDGVKYMMENAKDQKFEILCNIDMQGQTLTPIGTFEGMIRGGNFTISNFTLQGDGESFGFVSVNKGKIQNLLLDQVTFQPGANAGSIGTLVGDNQGEVSRCNVTGSMKVEKAAADANCGSLAGISAGELINCVVTVDLNYTAPGKANVGGIAGCITGGTAEYIDTMGRLDVTDCANKSVGLFAGSLEAVTMPNCVFSGASNTRDNKLFENFTGDPDDDELVTAQGAKLRDNGREPLTPAQDALRTRVVEEMNKMGTVEWKVREDIRHSCTCMLNTCHGVFTSVRTYYGIPYNHKGGSLARMEYTLDDEGYVVDWGYGQPAFDGLDIYAGNDCSSAVAHAWWTVSNSTDFMRTTYLTPHYIDYPNPSDSLESSGVIVVGDINANFTMPSNQWTINFLDYNTEQQMMEAYAQMRKGDCYTYIIKEGGHTRMVVEDPVVVRDQQGLIDPNYSYVICTEQGSPITDDEKMTYTTWKVNFKYTFGALLGRCVVPATCEELLTGEMEPAQCELLNGADGYIGLFNGTVKANYFLDSVALVIKDSDGNVVLDHTLWTTIAKSTDAHNDGLTRNYVDSFDLQNFAMPLSKVQLEEGETYTYSFTANLHTYDSFVVKEDSFTYGQA